MSVDKINHSVDFIKKKKKGINAVQKANKICSVYDEDC